MTPEVQHLYNQFAYNMLPAGKKQDTYKAYAVLATMLATQFPNAAPETPLSLLKLLESRDLITRML